MQHSTPFLRYMQRISAENFHCAEPEKSGIPAYIPFLDYTGHLDVIRVLHQRQDAERHL